MILGSISRRGTPERQRRGTAKDMKPPKNPKEATLEDSMRMQKNSKINTKKLETIKGCLQPSGAIVHFGVQIS